MSYHVTGIISTALYLLTLAGIYSQITVLSKRKEMVRNGALPVGQVTAVLSLNQFSMSFLAFYSLLLFGALLEPSDHYLVWPRILACLLVIVILYEIQCDRRDRLSLFIFGAASLSLVVACTLLAVDLNLPFDASRLSQFLVLAVAITLLQGYLHQIFLILRRGYVGAVSLRMHQLLFAKDLSMVFFALAMGLTRGWPVLTLACSSALTKLALFWAYWLVNRKGDDAVGTK